MPALNTAKMTARQFLELGEDPPGVRLELVDGEVEVSPSPSPEHSYTDKMLTFILQGHIRAGKLGQLYGDVDTIFGPHDVRRPDLLFYAKQRTHLIGKKAMQGPPDLAVEIVSPTSRKNDRDIKFKLYAQGGVICYWIIDPQERTLEAFTLRNNRYVLTASGAGAVMISAPPFPDCPIPLGELWQPEA